MTLSVASLRLAAGLEAKGEHCTRLVPMTATKQREDEHGLRMLTGETGEVLLAASPAC